jgi:hypothetical protein
MLVVAFMVALAFASGALLALRHRRGRRSPGLSSSLDPMPAGVKHLARTVSDLSDLGLHLPSGRGTALAGKPRLAALLDLRHP